MGTRASIITVVAVLAAGCGERPFEPAATPAPSFQIATERLVIDGPFSLRDRIGGDFQPFDLNDRGDVVGSVPGVGSGILPGDGGALQLLPPIMVGGANAPAVLTALNQLGVAAGFVTDHPSGGTPRSRPLLWSPGSDPEIGPYLPGASGGEAHVVSALDVNDAGVVVGSFGDQVGPPQRPYRWASGAAAAELLDASTADDGRAAAVNSAGLTVGDLGGVSLPVPGYNGAVWSPTGVLTFLPGADFLRDVNAAGQIAGRTPAFCPTLWDTDLAVLWQAPCGPTFAATAMALNDLGHFLYHGATDADPTLRPRLRVEAAEVATLPPWPGAEVTHAIALNSRGTILGSAGSADGSAVDAVYWTYRIEPIPADELIQALLDAVDEAESAGTLGSGNANALRAKLDAASRHLAAGRCTAAEGVLEAFISQVNALERSGALSATEAADLRAAAEAALAEIAATCP